MAIHDDMMINLNIINYNSSKTENINNIDYENKILQEGNIFLLICNCSSIFSSVSSMFDFGRSPPSGP